MSRSLNRIEMKPCRRHGSLMLNDKSGGGSEGCLADDAGFHKRHNSLRESLRPPDFLLRHRLHGSRRVRNRLVRNLIPEPKRWRRVPEA